MQSRWPDSYRLRDLVLASTALLVLAPLFLLIMAGLRLTQHRVLFCQQRPGLGGRLFTLFKFSTLYDAAPGEDEAAHTRARLTPLGRYLRAWSLDELPQLINVLRGDMSLVGPRPLLPEYLPLYSAEEHRRHDVPPGITGWAQVHGRNALTFKARFQLDLWYVAHRSLWLDARIMLLTLRQMLRRHEVYASATQTAARYDGSN
ncbi:MAG: sugar transferase [Bacteroidia bacterium]